MHNRVILCQESFDIHNCLELFRYYFAWWSRNTWDNVLPFISDISRCPKSMTTAGHTQFQRPTLVGNPPVLGIIKINMDGSYYLGSNTGGIDGIFWDHKGQILLILVSMSQQIQLFRQRSQSFVKVFSLQLYLNGIILLPSLLNLISKMRSLGSLPLHRVYGDFKTPLGNASTSLPVTYLSSSIIFIILAIRPFIFFYFLFFENCNETIFIEARLDVSSSNLIVYT